MTIIKNKTLNRAKRCERIWIYVMFFAKIIGKNLSNKYGQIIIDTTKKSATDAIKTASQRAIQKTAEATGKITSISKKSTKKLPIIDEDAELSTYKKRYISPKERQQITDELRLVP